MTVTLVCIASIVLLLVFPAESSLSCEPGEEDDCSNCYKVLVSQVIDNDENQFRIQNTFFPPNKSAPVFVTVYYHYKDAFKGSLSKEAEVWFWSTSTFYLYHPLHVFQFTSLFFSDMNLLSSTVNLTLNSTCKDAHLDHKRLLTQRLKLHATEKSIYSPISNSYDPKVENVLSLNEWHTNNKDKSGFISSTFIFFPSLTILIIVIGMIYFNHLAYNSRIYKHKEIFEGSDQNKKMAVQWHLQNEVIISLVFVVFAFCLSAAAVGFTNETEHHVAEVQKYFSYTNNNTYLAYMTSISIITFLYDFFILLGLVINLVIVLILAYKSKNASWTCCAYTIIFPLSCVANHFNYIIIAFIHDLYHATSIAIAYGIMIVFIFGALKQLSFILGKPHKLCKGPNDYRNFDDAQQQGNCWYKHNLVIQFIIKTIIALFLCGYAMFDIALYFTLPINNAFDDAANHFISIYQTTVLFFAAIAAYFLINKPERSIVDIFTKAEFKKKIFNQQVTDNWKNLTKDERDIEMATEILRILKKIKDT